MLHRNPFYHGKVHKEFYIYLLSFLFYTLIAWDLLRIDVYGFKAFCEWFLTAYPTYFVSPLRISGSAVESLFSQYKHIAGGKLDSVNYTTARGAHLMKQIVSEHHSGADYRDQTISVPELGLKKKVYNNANSSKTF